uniref:C2H2-type domain-containing protein n=1 Tax=Electrophorus electricus TaxID=8005 RepID=A0AAY5EZQ7_ELEEL
MGNLQNHCRRCHGLATVCTDGERPFPCPDCGMRFSHRATLRLHQRRMHSTERGSVT